MSVHSPDSVNLYRTVYSFRTNRTVLHTDTETAEVFLTIKNTSTNAPTLALRGTGPLSRIAPGLGPTTKIKSGKG